MGKERLINFVRKDAVWTFRAYVALVSVFWLVIVLDYTFGFGWGYAQRSLWLPPLMLLFGGFVRLFQITIQKILNSFRLD